MLAAQVGLCQQLKAMLKTLASSHDKLFGFPAMLLKTLAWLSSHVAQNSGFQP